MRASNNIILVLMIAVAACGGRRSGSVRDAMAGGDAGAPIDSGDAIDAGALGDGGPRDSGPPMMDAGEMVVCSGPGPGGDCVLLVPVGRFGPLGPACLPRCSAATGRAYRACTTLSCRNAAVDADTTPGIPYFTGSAPTSPPLDCASCVTYGEFHCFSLVCQDEVDRYVDHCIAGVTPSLCDPSITAIDNCLATLTPTETTTVDDCMGSVAGPAGCFACE